MNEKLLSRDDFREGVFSRDNHKCVICGGPGQDAHHIVERRLWDNGGYFLSNGATLCGPHHIQAEQTTLSCDEIREAAGIKTVLLPEHLYADNDYQYDKWGNIIMSTGVRIKGELFHDESVQKILEQGDVLKDFISYVKYPRTMHCTWSEKLGKDDRRLDSMKSFEGEEVVVTEKLDGENTTMYRDYIHARSINSGSHPSRDWVKGLWSRISYEIPEGWRICGENMYAVHTIKYDSLKSYFYVFSIWDSNNRCLTWDETLEWCELLGLETVPVLYRGIYDEQSIKKSAIQVDHKLEGYVIRKADTYTYAEFKKSVCKFVAGDFVIKHGHWTQQKMEINNLR